MTVNHNHFIAICCLISAMCFGWVSISSLALGMERIKETNTSRSELVATHFDDLEQVKMPLLLHEMGFHANSCDAEAHVTPETAVELDNDSWSVTYTGTVICHGPEITMYIPSKIGFFVDSDRNLKSSWTILELFLKE